MICSIRFQSKQVKFKDGYVTVFFTLAITMTISLILGILYSVRENALRMRTVLAVDTALTSVFAEYNRELWKQYDLIFVDSSYMTDSYGMSLSENHLKDCLNKNFDENSLELLGGRDLLKLECSLAEAKGVNLFTDNNFAAFRNQAINQMKYYYKIEYLDVAADWAKTIEDYNLSGGASYAEAQGASDELIAEYDLDYSHWLPSTTGGNDLSEDNISGWGILAKVTDISKISRTKFDKKDTVGKRDLNEGNLEITYEKSISDYFFIREYADTYFGNYIHPIDGKVLTYETEYIVSGKNSDSDNLASVVRRIMVIREAANMITLYSDTERISQIRAICELICTLLGIPEATELLVCVAVACWSNFESLADVRILLKGGKIPLIKEPTQWITGVRMALFGEGNVENYDEGLSYEDFLKIFMYMTGEKKVLSRMADLIELNVRSTEGNEYFRLDNCFDEWIAEIQITSSFGYNYISTRRRRILN